MDYCETPKGTKVHVGSCWKMFSDFGKPFYLHVIGIRPQYVMVSVISGGKVQHKTSVDNGIFDKSVPVPKEEEEEVALSVLAEL